MRCIDIYTYIRTYIHMYIHIFLIKSIIFAKKKQKKFSEKMGCCLWYTEAPQTHLHWKWRERAKNNDQGGGVLSCPPGSKPSLPVCALLLHWARCARGTNKWDRADNCNNIKWLSTDKADNCSHYKQKEKASLWRLAEGRRKAQKAHVLTTWWSERGGVNWAGLQNQNRPNGCQDMSTHCAHWYQPSPPRDGFLCCSHSEAPSLYAFTLVTVTAVLLFHPHTDQHPSYAARMSSSSWVWISHGKETSDLEPRRAVNHRVRPHQGFTSGLWGDL